MIDFGRGKGDMFLYPCSSGKTNLTFGKSLYNGGTKIQELNRQKLLDDFKNDMAICLLSLSIHVNSLQSSSQKSFKLHQTLIAISRLNRARPCGKENLFHCKR
jgi:hypothetical protein